MTYKFCTVENTSISVIFESLIAKPTFHGFFFILVYTFCCIILHLYTEICEINYFINIELNSKNFNNRLSKTFYKYLKFENVSLKNVLILY